MDWPYLYTINPPLKTGEEKIPRRHPFLSTPMLKYFLMIITQRTTSPREYLCLPARQYRHAKLCFILEYFGPKIIHNVSVQLMKWTIHLFIFLYLLLYFLGLENPRLSQNRFFFLLRMRAELLLLPKSKSIRVLTECQLVSACKIRF